MIGKLMMSTKQKGAETLKEDLLKVEWILFNWNRVFAWP
jgi:hypothetical protein